jgi:hypothetical protein
VTYFLTYIALLFGGLSTRKNVNLRGILYYACLFGLFIFVGFRYRVGCDWGGYLVIFNSARRNELFSSGIEPAFFAANQFLHYFELEYPYINVIASAGFFVGLGALARRQPDPLNFLVLAFPILILNLAMSALRQSLAFGFLCFAFNAFVDKRLGWYVGFVAIAMTFHTSAGAFLLLAPFIRGDFSRKRIALGALLALPGLYYLMTSTFYEMYARRYIGTATEAFGAPFRTALVAASAITFLWLFDRKWKELFPSDYKMVKLLSYAMIAVFPISFLSSVAGDRFGYYLSAIQLVILARLPFMVTGRRSTWWYMAPHMVLGLTLLMWVLRSSLFEKCYVPYQTWL